ncbi:MAG TPA: YjbH domain-containing protein [Rhizomicrobium sp.]|jgi:hypothetical protein|nr:YjbH domain-containing protein [Rhizomicrobium sp.]
MVPGTHAAFAQEQLSPLRTTYGDIGLVEMPSARMAEDGEISATGAAFTGNQRYSIGFQALPWLEGSFRYSRIEDRGRNDPDYDRSFGLKIRFFKESDYFPEVSLGIRDLVGTGILGQEYIVASKQIWDFDVTGGLGWGRLASDQALPNPLGWISNSFDHRGSRVGTGGTPTLNQWFHGPNMGVFGGFIWHTPIDRLDVIAEYSSDRYVRETRPNAGPFRYREPVNVGIAYHFFDAGSITASWLYGDTFGVTVSLSANPSASNYANLFGTAPMPFVQRSADERKDAVASLVNDSGDVDAVSTNAPWVTLAAPSNSIQARLTAELNRTGAHIKDVEIEGGTLVINLPGATRTNCAQYAQLAANVRAGLQSVAVTDLDNPRAQVAVCAVKAPITIKSGVVLASANMDSFSMADGSANGPDSLGGAADASSVPTVAANLTNSPLSNADAERKIRADAAAQGIQINAVVLGPHEAKVYFTNSTYYFEAEAIGRLTRVLSADSPANIEIFRFISVDVGVAELETRVVRAPFERMMLLYGHTQELADAIEIAPAPMRNPALVEQDAGSFPQFSWGISPDFRQNLFDPKDPVQLQIAALASGSVEIAPGLGIGAVLDGNIWNDFNLNRPSNSKLPHVRSDFEKYLRDGEYGVAGLDVNYFTRVAPDVYFEARAGYLESMFGGFGAQVLWRPVGERWAIGADVYQVWQRNFDRLFGFQHYNVVTGHVSVYYQSPWYGLDFAVHAGRYLAGDYGATFELTRQFSSGVQIGAFATFTNVPFKKFGEGSFDKGIIIHIPLEWAFPFATQSSYDVALRPLTRDGGARLAGDDSLYGETGRASYGEISQHLDDIAYPR